MAFSCSLSPSEQQQIQQWVDAHGTPQQVALRCRIVLATAEGQSDVAIAERLSVNRKTVILWRERFSEQRLDGLWEIAPGRGRKPTYNIDKIAAIVEATLQTKPEGMTHWSCRTLAKNQGVSKSMINHIWQAHNLKPHRVETFKLSRDPKFLEKMTDVFVLYLNPPQQAIVLCVDEKSQIHGGWRRLPCPTTFRGEPPCRSLDRTWFRPCRGRRHIGSGIDVIRDCARQPAASVNEWAASVAATVIRGP